jgi:hypothetical protein
LVLRAVAPAATSCAARATLAALRSLLARASQLLKLGLTPQVKLPVTLRQPELVRLALQPDLQPAPQPMARRRETPLAPPMLGAQER